MEYSVKNVKTGPSREYGPKGSYTATLYNGKKKIATVFEAGDGGPIEVKFIGKRTVTVRSFGHDVLVDPEQIELEEFCKNETYLCDYENKQVSFVPEIYIAKLVEDFEVNKQVKGWCRNKTIVKMKTDGEGEYTTFKCKFSADIKKAIESRYGDKIVEFVNERFIA